VEEQGVNRAERKVMLTHIFCRSLAFAANQTGMYLCTIKYYIFIVKNYGDIDILYINCPYI
jgi:hypothetical protein